MEISVSCHPAKFTILASVIETIQPRTEELYICDSTYYAFLFSRLMVLHCQVLPPVKGQVGFEMTHIPHDNVTTSVSRLLAIASFVFLGKHS